MRTTRQATTTRLARRGPLVVTVVAPDGKVQRAVRCRNRDEAIEVVETEAADAPLWTLFLLTREERGRVAPVGRWAIGHQGLVRTPYRRK